jgi:flagellar biosynthetic protein FliR
VEVLTYNLDQVERWLLMLFRIGAMFMSMPFFGMSSFPVRVRAGFAFLVTTILFPVQAPTELILQPHIIVFFGVILKEIIIGLAIGMIGTFMFYGFEFAGKVAGQTMGLGIINVMDPLSDANVPLLAQINNMLAMMLFLIIGGHHFLLRAINESFVRIPLGGGTFSPALVEGFARFSADIFVIGIKIGAPVLVAILVMEFALGILSRTVPQMNVWLVGFPLKIGLGLVTLAMTLPFFVFVFAKLYTKWQGNFIDFIITIAG